MENNNNDALMSEKIENLAVALSKAQAAIENVSRDKQGHGYKYADLASCLSAVKKPLADNGLSLSQLVSQDKSGKQMLVTLLIHESGQWLKSIFCIESVIVKTRDGAIKGNSLQNIGAGLTYVRRYALAAIVGLTQEDDDAQSVSKVTVEKKVPGLTIAKEFMNLCTEHNLNAQEFAKFHNIDSKYSETVTNGIANFNFLKEKFLNASNTITH
jgi:hypothetical protein